jgi:hypothetical protein
MPVHEQLVSAHRSHLPLDWLLFSVLATVLGTLKPLAHTRDGNSCFASYFENMNQRCRQ